MTTKLTKLYLTQDEGGLVAGRVHWDPKSRLVTWLMPGGRQRAYTVAKRIPARAGEAFAFVDDQGRRFTLRVLTPALYNAHVRRPRQRKLRTQRELRRAYDRSLR